MTFSFPVHIFGPKADSRTRVITTAFLGACAWFLPIIAVLLLNILLFVVLWLHGGLTKTNRQRAKYYTVFILFWLGTKFLMDCFNPQLSLKDQLIIVGTLGLRLLALASLSFIIIQNTSSKELGQTLSWFLRPFLRNRAWKASLALAIMLSALPRIGRTLSALNQTFHIRNPNLSLIRRIIFISLAALRISAQETENIATAILSRDLYRPEPWENDQINP